MENNKLSFIQKQKKNIILLAIVLTAIIVAFALLSDINEVIKIIFEVKLLFIFLGLSLIFLYYILDALSFHVILGKHYNYKLKHTFLLAFSAHFFDGITPLATGSQPFQIYFMKKQGIQISNSTGIMLIRVITFQLSLTFFATISLILFWNTFVNNPSIAYLIFIGLAINIILLGMFVLFAISKRFKYSFTYIFFAIVGKLPYFKRFRDKKQNFLDGFDNVQKNFKMILSLKTTFIISFILSLLKLAALYTIPFVIFYSLGVDVQGKFFLMMATASLIMAISAYVPSPGASGGAEYIYNELYNPLVANIANPAETIVAAMILWRSLTYYMGLIVGFVATLLVESTFKENEYFYVSEKDYGKKSRKKKKELKEKNKT